MSAGPLWFNSAVVIRNSRPCVEPAELEPEAIEAERSLLLDTIARASECIRRANVRLERLNRQGVRR